MQTVFFLIILESSGYEEMIVLEMGILLVFAAALLGCVWSGASILYAMLFGYGLFFAYGRLRGRGGRRLLAVSASGIWTVRNVLVTFLLIGMITALWRVCGTIAFLVYHATALCTPRGMLLAAFLLCCLVSSLTGTAFGTAATVGVITMTMANSMGLPPLFTGGAILSGIYFGDRCSPMSTSALLVSELTGTDLFENIKKMTRTGLVPFLLACGVYALAGLGVHAAPAGDGARALLAEGFCLHPAALVCRRIT